MIRVIFGLNGQLVCSLDVYSTDDEEQAIKEAECWMYFNKPNYKFDSMKAIKK